MALSPVIPLMVGLFSQDYADGAFPLFHWVFFVALHPFVPLTVFVCFTFIGPFV